MATLKDRIDNEQEVQKKRVLAQASSDAIDEKHRRYDRQSRLDRLSYVANIDAEAAEAAWLEIRETVDDLKALREARRRAIDARELATEVAEMHTAARRDPLLKSFDPTTACR